MGNSLGFREQEGASKAVAGLLFVHVCRQFIVHQQVAELVG